jgi:hypothetical protein
MSNKCEALCMANPLSEELLFSTELRAFRLSGGNRFAAWHPTLYLSGKLGSCVLPRPIPEFQGALQRLYVARTAWPLKMLLTGQVLDDAFAYGRPKYAALALRDIPPIDKLKYCRSCAFEQRSEFGFSMWERSLNLPLVTMCPIHREYLNAVDTGAVMEGPGLLPHEICTVGHWEPRNSALQVSETIIELCRMANAIDAGALRGLIENLRENRNQQRSNGQPDGTLGSADSSGLNSHCLSSSGLLEAELAVITKNVDAAYVLANCAQIPAMCFYLPGSRDPFSFDDLLGPHFSATPSRYEALREYCRKRLKLGPVYTPYCPNRDFASQQAVYVLLMFLVDRMWIRRWVESQEWRNSAYSSIAEADLQAGLLLSVDNKDSSRKLRSLLNRRDVIDFIASRYNRRPELARFLDGCKRTTRALGRLVREEATGRQFD